ncbi:MAG: hypothetical protein KA419_02110 [Acidobacteria bacterium]|nr:hypothetical protein [Acidobacteriota bacterium]
MVIALLLLSPLALAALLLPLRSPRLNAFVIKLFAVGHLAGTVALWLRPDSWTPYFAIDPLNILFLLLLSVLNFGTSFYQGVFLKRSGLTARWHTFYAVFLLLFLFSMTGLLLSTHLGLLWVFMEATTLAGAPFLYYEGNRAALEATWKFVFICSVGIALAFVGILLLSMGLGPGDTLFFADLEANARGINPFWLGLSIPFLLVGFGTKVGLAPVHAWLPDAHAEAPSPISAMLSGALLNTAFLGILRFMKIAERAGRGEAVSRLLLVMGFLSLFVCAVFVLRSRNYKRLLAYSSVENMGLAAIGAGLGGIGLLAAVIHLTSHSLAKAGCFLTAGNILHRYRTKEIDDVRGVLRADPASGGLWLAGFAALAAFPPSPAFLSEFFMIQAMLGRGWGWMIVPFALLIAVIVFGMGRSVLGMAFGTPIGKLRPGRIPAANYWPQAAFLLAAATVGCWAVAPLTRLLREAAAYLGG